MRPEYEIFMETPLWMQVWEQKMAHIIVYSLFLAGIISVMILKDRVAKNPRLMNVLRYSILGISFVYVGLVLKAQPTTTNLIIPLNSARELRFPVDLFLLEPYIFLSFVFIIVTVVAWGRGVFCGWLCPYGAMTELLYKLRERAFPRLRLRAAYAVHTRLIYLKYIIFLGIAGVSFYSFILSEYLTEIEPFRTFVLKLDREWYFVAYFLLVTSASVVVYRAFCRYLCPLGAALAIPSFLKQVPLVDLKRYDMCGSCRICGRACAPAAIASSGFIDSRECLSCMDCQMNFWNEDICPVLKRRRKKGEEGAAAPRSAAIIFAAVCALLFAFQSTGDTKTLHVGSDYMTIGEAVENAEQGDVVQVEGGTYRGNIEIRKAVHLKGINYPVLSAEDGHIVEVTGPGVTVEGFRLMYEGAEISPGSSAIYIDKGADGAVIRNNRLVNVLFGIWNVEGKDIRIEGNEITGANISNTNYRGNCINLTGSQQVYIAGNILSNCRDGIYMELCHDAEVRGNRIKDSRYSVHTMWVDRGIFSGNEAHDNLVGLAIMYTKHSEITDNLSYGNRTHGLLIIQSVRSEIKDNTVIGNTKGVFLYNSVYNTIENNLVMNNQLGIHNWGGSEENAIKGNSFIQNEVQVKFVAGRDQRWDNNYWSDYIGWDMSGDGIGDMPYESNSVIDHIFWRYPAAKILFASPALHVLWMLEKQFPLLKVPKVTDNRPLMTARHEGWKEILNRYEDYIPERIYGDIDKLLHMPGGGL